MTNDIEGRNGGVSKDKHGADTHPAFGMIQVSRVSQGGRGAVLFDSDVQHGHYMILRVHEASRKRDLHRDWIHDTGRLIEVAMSEAQWAEAISSPNTSGTPCTIRWVKGEGSRPALEFDSRLDLLHNEVRDKAKEAMAEVDAAMEAFSEKPNAAHKRRLAAAITNLPANMEFAASSLTEHAEKVVAKSKADIEAAAMAAAERMGIAPSRFIEIEEGAGGAPRELE